MDVFGVYKKLLGKYGPQGWWPLLIEGERNDRIMPLRIEHGLTYGIAYNKLFEFKTAFRDPYFEIAVGAILAQSAAWRNVAKAIFNLYQARALTSQRILKLGTARLQKIIRPAGYYKQKTKKLLLFSRWLVNRHQGDIRSLGRRPITEIRSLLLEQWGIGKETADSIILYALNKPIFVIDEYTRRLCKQYKVEFKEYDDYRKLFESGLCTHLHSQERSPTIFQDFHALIVAFGKEKCNS